MTMTHKEAIDRVMGKGPWPNDYDGTAKRLKDYIEARGLVLVPKEPCNEMLEVYRSNVKPRPFYRTAARVVRSMLAAAPDPFEDGE